jgi:GH15 family glucan-1,4-alpha-glucosidase
MIERLYNPFIKRATDFLTKYRDKKTGLPLPSHDLWEERFGTFTYTAASVYAALKNAAQFANMLGKHVSAKRWDSAAEEVKEGILTHLIHEDGRVLKSIQYAHFSPEPDFTVDASSFYGLFRFGVLPADDSRLARAYEVVKERLSTGEDRIGIARYEGDYYFRSAQNVPGNPWIITTLWLAEYEIARAKTGTDLAPAMARLEWTVAHANQAGLLAEQFDPNTYQSTSVTPLTWSHAQYVITFLAYVKKMQELGVCAKP